MVENGSYLDDYSNVVKEVSVCIAETIESISKCLTLYNDLPLSSTTVKAILLIELMFPLNRGFTIFDNRPNEYIRADLLKLYSYMKRNKIPFGYIPCSVDYTIEINNIYDIYREYDYRWFGMNEPERFLQYKTDPTEEQGSESQIQYPEIIEDLESEYNRLKESS